MNMKKTLIATLTLVSLVASPAFAQSNTHRMPHTNSATDNIYASEGNSSAQNPNVVTFANRVVGQDPDANIRTQLLRDPIPVSQ